MRRVELLFSIQLLLFPNCESLESGSQRKLAAKQQLESLRLAHTSSTPDSERLMCNLKLCSRSACEEERVLRTSKDRIVENRTIQFSVQRMQEEAFEKIQ